MTPNYGKSLCASSDGSSLTATDVELVRQKCMVCSAMLRWRKVGRKKVLQQLWQDFYSDFQEWIDVPNEKEEIK